MNNRVIAGIVLIVIALVAGFFLFNSNAGESQQTGNTIDMTPGATPGSISDGSGSSSNTSTGGSSTSTTPREISISAARFEYTPNVIRVKKGELIKLSIDNTDTTHGILIRDLGVSGIESVEFTANTTGTFEFRCPTMCGSGHRGMVGTLIVEE